VDIPSNISLPVSSDNSLFDLFNYYIDSFTDGIPLTEYVDVFKRDELKFDLYLKTNKYLGEDIYTLSSVSLNTDRVTIERQIRNGQNNYNPFEGTPDDISYSTPISSTNLADSGATAGTNLSNSDVVWQFVDGTVEGAWLKRSDEEFTTSEACIRLPRGVSEFRFPYANRGLSGEGIGWTGKGVSNCSVVPYVSLEERNLAARIDEVYWNDQSALSSVKPISLNQTQLVDSGAQASKIIEEADQIQVKSTRDSEVSDTAWLFDFDRTELPITCGTNVIYYPLFRFGDTGRTFQFNISPDQTESKPLSSIGITKSMCGAIAGTTPETADQILKQSGQCENPTEGAWLSSCELASIDYDCVLTPLSVKKEYLPLPVMLVDRVDDLPERDTTDVIVLGEGSFSDIEVPDWATRAIVKVRTAGSLPRENGTYIDNTVWVQDIAISEVKMEDASDDDGGSIPPYEYGGVPHYTNLVDTGSNNSSDSILDSTVMEVPLIENFIQVRVKHDILGDDPSSFSQTSQVYLIGFEGDVAVGIDENPWRKALLPEPIMVTEHTTQGDVFDQTYNFGEGVLSSVEIPSWATRAIVKSRTGGRLDRRTSSYDRHLDTIIEVQDITTAEVKMKSVNADPSLSAMQYEYGGTPHIVQVPPINSSNSDVSVVDSSVMSIPLVGDALNVKIKHDSMINSGGANTSQLYFLGFEGNGGSTMELDMVSPLKKSLLSSPVLVYNKVDQIPEADSEEVVDLGDIGIDMDVPKWATRAIVKARTSGSINTDAATFSSVVQVQGVAVSEVKFHDATNELKYTYGGQPHQSVMGDPDHNDSLVDSSVMSVPISDTTLTIRPIHETFDRGPSWENPFYSQTTQVYILGFEGDTSGIDCELEGGECDFNCDQRPNNDTARQTGLHMVNRSGNMSHFFWEFDDLPADVAINGYDHDEHCNYRKIDSYSSIINPSVSDELNQWKHCNCKAVYYSPIGNTLDNFESFSDFSDVIYIDSGVEPFSLATWTDPDGNDYRNSDQFGVFKYKGDEPDSGFGIGTWETLKGEPLILKKGNSYVYRRASFGGCTDVTAPPLVVNNCHCYDNCNDNICATEWVKMIKNDSGVWESTGEITDMTMDAGSFYQYIKRGSIKYKVWKNGTEYERSIETPSFSLNILFDNPKPYWASSPNFYGLDVGISAFESDEYLLTTQPNPSEIVLTDDIYVKYTSNGCDPIIWKEDLEFSIDLGIPDSWRKIQFSDESPDLLRKIIGCGSCELVFPDTPNTCNIRENKCDSFFTSIEATDELSDMAIRTPINCGETTQFFYYAKEAFTWTQDFNDVISVNDQSAVSLFSTARSPWSNLFNTDEALVRVREDKEELKTKGNIGVFKPENVGVNKIECFGIQNEVI